MTRSRAPKVDDFNSKIIAEFRANGGKVGGPFQGADILLLHHTGRTAGRSGSTRSPFSGFGNSLAVFASKAGAPRNPAWFHNLIAYPETTIEVGTKAIKVLARVAQPTEREVIYTRQRQRNPGFAEYEVKGRAAQNSGGRARSS